MLEKFNRWLRGEFVCVKCGKTWYSFGSFGFGKMICPECYKPTDLTEWLFPDMSYWLNRLIFRGKLNVERRI